MGMPVLGAIHCLHYSPSQQKHSNKRELHTIFCYNTIITDRPTVQCDLSHMLRYEWVDVGMLDYNPANKLYYIKRVHVPNYILQAKSLKFDSEEKSKESSDSGSESNGSGSGVKLESSMEGEAGGASDGEQIAPQPKLSMQQVR